MDDLLEFILRVLIYIVIAIVVIVVSYSLKKYRNNLNVKSYPSVTDKKNVKQEIKNLKSNKVGYQNILSTISKKYKLRKDIVRGLVIDIEKESTADLSQIKKVEKEKFTFNYPGNWRIEKADKDLDENLFFSVEGSYSAIIVFSLLGHITENIPILEEILSSIKSEYKEFSEVSRFEKWGAYRGEGIRFSAISLTSPCEGFVFLYSDGKNSFSINQISVIDDIENTIDGFKLIEKTFMINK